MNGIRLDSHQMQIRSYEDLEFPAEFFNDKPTYRTWFSMALGVHALKCSCDPTFTDQTRNNQDSIRGACPELQNKKPAGCTPEKYSRYGLDLAANCHPTSTFPIILGAAKKVCPMQFAKMFRITANAQSLTLVTFYNPNEYMLFVRPDQPPQGMPHPGNKLNAFVCRSSDYHIYKLTCPHVNDAEPPRQRWQTVPCFANGLSLAAKIRKYDPISAT